MSARQKLNHSMVNGCVVVAAVIGVLSGSWLVFAAALAGGVLLHIHSGDIRLGPRKQRR